MLQSNPNFTILLCAWLAVHNWTIFYALIRWGKLTFKVDASLVILSLIAPSRVGFNLYYLKNLGLFYEYIIKAARMNEEHMNLHGSYRWIVKLEKCSAQISMFFNPNEYSAPMTIKKNKILGTALELPARQHCQFSPFTVKRALMGWIGSAV